MNGFFYTLSSIEEGGCLIFPSRDYDPTIGR